MSKIIVGSARFDENGKATGGAVGDQTGKEVCTQDFYVHSLGWYILRPKSVVHANAIASNMGKACSNNNIGYDQSNRLGVVTYGINTTTKTECDCSSLVRQVVKESTGKDPGNFTTADEASKLEATGLFEKKVAYVSQTATPVYNGDVLVTKTKGHTVVVTSGNPRTETVNAATIKIGDVVSIASGATYYDGTKKVPDWVLKKQWIVKSASGDRVVVDKSTDGKSSIGSPINAKYLTVVRASIIVSPKPTPTPTKTLKVGAVVSISSGATYYNSTKKVPSWVLKTQWVVKSISGDRVVVDKSADGKSSINSPIASKYLTVK